MNTMAILVRNTAIRRFLIGPSRAQNKQERSQQALLASKLLANLIKQR